MRSIMGLFVLLLLVSCSTEPKDITFRAVDSENGTLDVTIMVDTDISSFEDVPSGWEYTATLDSDSGECYFYISAQRNMNNSGTVTVSIT